MSVSRRRLLHSALVAALGLIAPSGSGHALRLDRARSWTAALASGPAAARIGRCFLEAHPEEADLDTLLRRLALPSSPTTSALQAWSARQREEFATGRVAEVEGWLISHSEARLCGVTALLGG